jgi:DNA-binding Xre family transcriptional regulator
MTVRLRFPELLEARELTAYGLAKLTNGHLSKSMAYRLVAQRGAFRCLSPEQIEALCAALEVEPGQLLVREATKRRR